MKLHLNDPAGRKVFTGYGEGYVAINHQRYEHPVVVSPESASLWDAPAAVEELSPSHLQCVLQLNPEIVILGTGADLRFPRPDLGRTLAHAAIGFEAMDSKAACRTYNILMGEGRRVVAAILV